MKLDHICLMNIFLMYNVEIIWTGLSMSDQGQLICDSQKNQLYLSTDSWDIGRSEILYNLIGRKYFGQ